ncbi:hypothetical protein JKF63_00842 [Porcisia hertigi]|uniref:Uncharacterized protein n=1 Tax=Porcisia hertigi TaxID=2761500 RepID=A0A836I8Z2_9TRYP|nr:hypothetical protein JKF63_00842 [Porcisia hertigi]
MLSCSPRSRVWATRQLATTVVLLLLCVLVVVTGRTSARKQLPVNTPFPPVVQNALRCDVCSFIVTNALHQVEAKRKELHAKRLQVREDDVLEEVENMCVPFKEQGEWIRQVALQVEEKTPARSSAGSSVTATPQYQMSVGVVNYFSKCGRTCDTVAMLCEEWMDSSYMDGFSGRLVKEAKGRRDIDSTARRSAIFSTFCAPSPHCKKHAALVSKLNAALAKNSDLRAAISLDRPQEIEPEEREMETMLHRLTREQGQSADVFSRDEIRRMKDAFVNGNKEDVQAVDPVAFNLNDDEFATLQRYMRGEDGHEKQQQQQQREYRRSSSPTDADDL